MYYGAVKGALAIVERAMDASTCAELGLTKAAYEEVTSQTPWIGAQRQRARATLDTLCHATTDLIGLPRIEIPAEYVAAVIASFVHPVNIAVACSWMEGRLPAAQDLVVAGEPPPQGMDHLTAAQLFSMVCFILSDEDMGPVVSNFEKRVGLKTKKALGDG